MADAETIASLQQVSARLERIEGTLARLEGILAQSSGIAALAERATPGVAMVTDILDEWALAAGARGVDLDQRLARGLHLLQRLTEPGVADALEAVLDRMDRVQALLARLDALPGAVATVADTVDDFVMALADRGLDVEQVVRRGAAGLDRVARLVQSPAFQEVLDSGILEPHVVQVIGHLGRALSAARGEPGERAGLMALLRATRDPDVQRAIDFGLRFLRHFGDRIEPHETPAVDSAARKELPHG
ncbi:MAG TPA: DUF1641 domain-containing protein [Haliangium sp.]|nr:DUF1641 domain-containing protein [Haliangium sp.]